MPLFAGFALLVLWTHRANIGRLFKGTEPKVGEESGLIWRSRPTRSPGSD